MEFSDTFRIISDDCTEIGLTKDSDLIPPYTTDKIFINNYNRTEEGIISFTFSETEFPSLKCKINTLELQIWDLLFSVVIDREYYHQVISDIPESCRVTLLQPFLDIEDLLIPQFINNKIILRGNDKKIVCKNMGTGEELDINYLPTGMYKLTLRMNSLIFARHDDGYTDAIVTLNTEILELLYYPLPLRTSTPTEPKTCD